MFDTKIKRKVGEGVSVGGVVEVSGGGVVVAGEQGRGRWWEGRWWWWH